MLQSTELISLVNAVFKSSSAAAVSFRLSLTDGNFIPRDCLFLVSNAPNSLASCFSGELSLCTQPVEMDAHFFFVCCFFLCVCLWKLENIILVASVPKQREQEIDFLDTAVS